MVRPLEPGVRTAFCSHSNCNALTPPGSGAGGCATRRMKTLDQLADVLYPARLQPSARLPFCCIPLSLSQVLQQGCRGSVSKNDGLVAGQACRSACNSSMPEEVLDPSARPALC